VAVTAENRAPSADFTASCVDLTCDFTDGSTDPDGTVTAWSWTFGDGATSTEPSPRHTYAAGGTYTVGLTVTDDDGATGSTSRSVTVTAPPPPNALPTAAFTASCENLSCTFTDQSTDSDGRVTAWSWDFGDGESSSNQNPSHTYGDGGTYTVRLTVTDDRGGTGSASRSVTLNRRPVADPGGPYRSQDVVRFDGSGSADPDRDALTYAWDFGDGATGTGVAPTHTYTKDGKYTVTLVVTDADGARSAPATTTATIANEPPRVNAGPDVTMIPGIFTLRARFEDPGVDDGPFSYEITWGDGLSSSGSVASDSDEIVVGHPYLLPGTYQVRVLVRDSHGAVGQDEVIVTVTLL
jgi:PKD repeat protein